MVGGGSAHRGFRKSEIPEVSQRWKTKRQCEAPTLSVQARPSAHLQPGPREDLVILQDRSPRARFLTLPVV